MPLSPLDPNAQKAFTFYVIGYLAYFHSETYQAQFPVLLSSANSIEVDPLPAAERKAEWSQLRTQQYLQKTAMVQSICDNVFSLIGWHRYNDSPGVFHHLDVLDVLPRTRNIQVAENFGPDLPLLFKLHEIWSVDSHENH